jgi:nucleotide-binding universal stress UspA family protein
VGEQPVVVGVDGSPEGRAALDVAAVDATRRGAPLRIVHGFIWPYMNVALGPSDLGPPEGGLRNLAERIVSEAVAYAEVAAPGIPVTGDVIVGSAAQALIAASGDAELVVVGNRGMGAFAGLLLGSVAIQLAAHARSPVLVVRGTSPPGQPIVLAADGSPANDAAAGFAFGEAALRGAELVALHVWRDLPAAYVLEEALAGWRDKFPNVVVRQEIVHGGVRESLIGATRRAQLIVMGSRGRGGFSGLLLGSASQAVLQHAECPVAIVRTHP